MFYILTLYEKLRNYKVFIIKFADNINILTAKYNANVIKTLLKTFIKRAKVNLIVIK